MNEETRIEVDKNLVAIATYETESEAKILQIALVDSGIKATTVTDGLTAFLGHSGGGFGVSVCVRQAEAAEARKLVVEMKKENLLPGWKCICGEKVDEGHAICWSCGAEFGESLVAV